MSVETSQVPGSSVDKRIHPGQVRSECRSVVGPLFVGGHICIHLGRCILEHFTVC
jgi:hypothetical protein